MRAAAGQLERSLAALTVAIDQAKGSRAQALSEVSGEYDQQVRVPLAGQAAKLWSYVDKKVNWELPFLSAPQQRRVPFKTPQFSADFELLRPLPTKTDGTPMILVFQAHVIDWTANGSLWLSGATVRFAVQAPAAGDTELIPFSASAHLNFQGYASYPGGQDS